MFRVVTLWRLIIRRRLAVPAAACAALLASLPQPGRADPPAGPGTAPHAAPPALCAPCAEWNRTQPPFRIYGGTYYVGVRGLTALLITGDRGHILIDGDLPESVPKITASIGQLGFQLQDVQRLLNSHVHFDHAGGLAALQRLTGAPVMAPRFGRRARLGAAGGR